MNNGNLATIELLMCELDITFWDGDNKCVLFFSRDEAEAERKKILLAANHEYEDLIRNAISLPDSSELGIDRLQDAIEYLKSKKERISKLERWLASPKYEIRQRTIEVGGCSSIDQLSAKLASSGVANGLRKKFKDALPDLRCTATAIASSVAKIIASEIKHARELPPFFKTVLSYDPGNPADLVKFKYFAENDHGQALADIAYEDWFYPLFIPWLESIDDQTSREIGELLGKIESYLVNAAMSPGEVLSELLTHGEDFDPWNPE
jgi:hypothetical protein